MNKVSSHETVIQGASILDGEGGAPYCADIAINSGRITEIGKIDAPARHRIDANGFSLMPGIVDVHTHYDAQLTWDRTMSPSPALGVTTAVIGNCGFGIAPCPQEQRETMLKNLSVVEGMDLDALLTGTRWGFESFSEYLDQIRQLGPYANVAVLAGHSSIRTAVMGDAASSRAEPTAAELAAMKAIVKEAIEKGSSVEGITKAGVTIVAEVEDSLEVEEEVGILLEGMGMASLVEEEMAKTINLMILLE